MDNEPCALHIQKCGNLIQRRGDAVEGLFEDCQPRGVVGVAQGMRGQSRDSHLAAFQRLRRAFYPNQLANPGKVIPVSEEFEEFLMIPTYEYLD